MFLITNVYGQLHHAVKTHNNTLLINLLENSDCDINILDDEYNSPLFTALYNNNFEAFELLIEKGADINLENSFGENVLMASIKHDKFSFFKLLISNKNINIEKKASEIFYYSTAFSNFTYINELINKNIFEYLKSSPVHSDIKGIMLYGGNISHINSFKQYIYILFFALLIFMFILKADKIIKKNISKKIIILFPFICLLILLLFYSHPFPVADDWENFDLYHTFLTGDLKFSDLINSHNEHNIFIPKIILLIVSFFAGYNPVLLMFLSVTCFLIAFQFIVKSDNNKNLSLSALFTVSILMFSLRQIENFLWGFQFAFSFSFMTTIISIYYSNKFYKKDYAKCFIYALVFALISSFSSLMGIFSFLPLMLVTIFKKEYQKLIYTFILLIFSALILFKYSNPIADFYLKKDFFDYVLFLLSFAGSGFSSSRLLSIISGGIIFTSILILVKNIQKNDNLKKHCFNVSLIFYSIFTGILITIGRKNEFWTATQSRYSTFSIIGIIGLFLLVQNIVKFPNIKKIISFLIILFSVYNFYNGIFAAENIYKIKKTQQLYITQQNFNSDKINTDFFHVNSMIVKNYLKYKSRFNPLNKNTNEDFK